MRESSALPTFATDLLALRTQGKRPVGGIVLMDTWRSVPNARRVDLFAIYLRARDDWTCYDLAALSGLDVLLHLTESDDSRVDALIEHVKTFSPRSLRLFTPYRSEVLIGKDHALAELLRWWAVRARLASLRQAA